MNWGDGSATTPLGSLASGSATATHTYPSGGNYTVTLAATMADGTPESSSTSVFAGDYQVSISTPSSSANTSSPVTFTAATTPNTVAVESYTWAVTNETTGVVVKTDTTEGPTWQYKFEAPGTYRVRVTVNPRTGQSRSNSVLITVS